MSTLKTNNIQHVDRSDPSIIINTDGSVNIAGTMTYEDVTNVDSVGIITGRELINAQKQVHVGTGVSIAAGGINVTAGISTFGGDVSIADKIIHTGDTNTAIRFPSADTVTVETGGSERIRIASDGKIGIGINDPERLVHLSSNNTVVALTDTAASTDEKTRYILSDAGVFAIGKLSDDYNTATEHLRILTNGQVGINETSPSSYSSGANSVVITAASGSNAGITINNDAGGTDSGAIFFAHGSGANAVGRIRYYHSDDHMDFYTANAERLRIDSSGRLMIGQTSAYAATGTGKMMLTVTNSATSRTDAAISNQSSGDNASAAVVLATHGQDYILEATGSGNTTDGPRAFRLLKGSSERLHINTTGNAKFVGIVTATEFVSTVSPLTNRNKVINGGMVISQKNGTSSVQLSASEQYMVDRFKNDTGSSFDMKADASQVTDHPVGFSKSLKIQCDGVSTPSGSHNGGLSTFLEGLDVQDLGYGTSGAKPVTVSFYAKSATQNSGDTYGLMIGFFGENNGRQRQTRSFTVTDSWQRFEFTIQPNGTAQSEPIVNTNAIGFQIFWSLAAGSTDAVAEETTWNNTNSLVGVSGQSNFFDQVNNQFFLTGVQLEIGNKATLFEHKSFSDELKRCQRYYQTLPSALYIIRGSQSISYSNAPIQTSFILPEPMRANPTALNYDDGGSTITVTYYDASYGSATNYEAHIGSNILNGVVRFQLGHNQANNSNTALSTTYKWGVSQDSIAFDSEL